MASSSPYSHPVHPLFCYMYQGFMLPTTATTRIEDHHHYCTGQGQGSMMCTDYGYNDNTLCHYRWAYYCICRLQEQCMVQYIQDPEKYVFPTMQVSEIGQVVRQFYFTILYHGIIVTKCLSGTIFKTFPIENQGHPRSKVIVSNERPYTCSYQWIIITEVLIQHRFQDICQ